MNQKLFPVVVVSLVVTIVAFFGLRTITPTPSTPNERPIPQENLGAIPGNSIEGKYVTIGGIEHAYLKSNFVATTSRVCIFKNPFPNGTSSLIAFTVQNTNTINGANTFDLGTTTHANGFGATNTNPILRGLVFPSLKRTAFDGETGDKLPVLLDKRENLQFVRNATGTAGTDNYTGICQAEFIKL